MTLMAMHSAICFLHRRMPVACCSVRTVAFAFTMFGMLCFSLQDLSTCPSRILHPIGMMWMVMACWISSWYLLLDIQCFSNNGLSTRFVPSLIFSTQVRYHWFRYM